MKKRIYIAYTGGTIGMQPSGAGYVPAPGYLASQMRRMPEMDSPGMPEYHLQEYTPLLDSSNMTPADWMKVASDIADHYDQYDGFVILHGTDTMAYTASALAFILEGLGKPVILTGSQIPLCEVRNDARENLVTALMLAAECGIPEVCLYFGDRLLRGCRAVKVDAEGFEAFASPNFPPLGTVGVHVDLRRELIQPATEAGASLRVKEIRPQPIASLRIFPGLQTEIMRDLLAPPLAGLVLEAYGVGNGPTGDDAFVKALEEAVRRGVVIVDCSQCLRGRVDLSGYATGSALEKAGVISGYDLTVEAALVKLAFLFSQALSPEDVRREIQRNLRGELTPPDPADPFPTVKD